jgi:hypothetical protein
MSEWAPPKGWVLTRHEGYYINHQGVRLADGMRAEHLTQMPDGSIDVAWFDEDQPFYEDKNMKPGPGYGEEGFSPNVTLLPIKDGYVPPQYHLVHEKDPLHGTIEPANNVAT